MTNTTREEMKKHDFICYGEILWDILPTGAKPGGAPMNVAYHLKRLGHSPAIITKVGTDDRGNGLLDILKEKDIDTSYVQTDALTMTGIVHAQPNARGEMSYDIVAPAAWDNIQWSENLQTLFAAGTYLVFGSLICRNVTSKNTLFRLLEIAENKVLDINLRPPHYSEALLRDLLSKSDIVKLNREELELVSGWNSKSTSVEDQVKNVQETFNLNKLIVTLGGDGAILNMDGQMFRHRGYKIVVEDTVGSGDAFLAALLSGLKKKNPPAECLALACAVGALVTSRKGAWPDYELADVQQLRASSPEETSSTV